MSSLMVSNDLDIMMLEFAVEKLFLPTKSVFDSVIMKKTTVMFRLLDSDWIAVNPHRTDYVPYKGSNEKEADFHGGKSVVFAIPTGSLEMRMKGVHIQIHVIKEVSKYFEVNSSEERQNIGVALVNVDRLFNGIIKDLREREELKEYLNCIHKRQPISRSLKETYAILDEDQQETGATIGIYVRLSYFGKSVITEIERDRGLRRTFYAQEETNENSPYQCRELNQSELESGYWGSKTVLPPLRADQVVCCCDKWSVVDTGDKVDDESADRDKEKTGMGIAGKGRRHRESGESVEKRGRKSSGDHSQVSTVAKVKEAAGSSTKTEKPTRISKSADGKGRQTKTDGSKAAARMSETLGTNGRKSSGDHSPVSTIAKVKEAAGSRTKTEKPTRISKSADGKGRQTKTDGSKAAARMSETLGTNGRKSSGDQSPVNTIAKVKEAAGSSTKTEKPTRISKSADGQGRKTKTDGSKAAAMLGKTLKTSGSAVSTGQKPRTTSKNKRVRGDLRDRKTIGKLAKTAVAAEVLPEKSPIEAKHKKGDVRDSKSSSNEYAKLLEQLRKRPRGIVTIGINDKKKNICKETILPPPRPSSKCPKLSTFASPQLCKNLPYSSPCYYPRSYASNRRSFPPTHNCFIDTRIKRPEDLCTSLYQRNIPEIQILTN